MLAPVLARLSDVPGIVDARVDCSGTYFLLVGRDAAALDAALPRAQELLGNRATPLGPADAAAQLAARPRGEPWFDRDGIRGLSYVEGRILAQRMADAVAARVELDRQTAADVLEATRREVFAALEHAHDTGGRASSGWFWEEWPAIVARIGTRLEGLPAEVRARVVEVLGAERR